MTRIETTRLLLRLPVPGDHQVWAATRRESAEFLQPWEPGWSPDQLSRQTFEEKVDWARDVSESGTALPLVLIRREDDRLLGEITLDHIRRGPYQSASVGFWIGKMYQRNGYMFEALEALKQHAFETLDISRLEATCLIENVACRALLIKYQTLPTKASLEVQCKSRVGGAITKCSRCSVAIEFSGPPCQSRRLNGFSAARQAR